MWIKCDSNLLKEAASKFESLPTPPIPPLAPPLGAPRGKGSIWMFHSGSTDMAPRIVGKQVGSLFSPTFAALPLLASDLG